MCHCGEARTPTTPDCLFGILSSPASPDLTPADFHTSFPRLDTGRAASACAGFPTIESVAVLDGQGSQFSVVASANASVSAASLDQLFHGTATAGSAALSSNVNAKLLPPEDQNVQTSVGERRKRSRPGSASSDDGHGDIFEDLAFTTELTASSTGNSVPSAQHKLQGDSIAGDRLMDGEEAEACSAMRHTLLSESNSRSLASPPEDSSGQQALPSSLNDGGSAHTHCQDLSCCSQGDSLHRAMVASDTLDLRSQTAGGETGNLAKGRPNVGGRQSVQDSAGNSNSSSSVGESPSSQVWVNRAAYADRFVERTVRTKRDRWESVSADS